VDQSHTVIGLVGRINSWKGQPLLLDAFSMIASEYPFARLVFIGSAPPNQDFFVEDLQTSIANLNLAHQVRIIPFQQNIWQLWDSVDIAVVPSTEPEPFGMVAIEAMLAKKPVIAANHGGLTEIVLPNETGFLFEPGNAEALAQSLRQMLDNPQLRTRFGEAGYDRAAVHFSLDSHVRKFEQIFEQIIR
jgi:glycosyltransferase involved in cell wall biosynthesis